MSISLATKGVLRQPCPGEAGFDVDRTDGLLETAAELSAVIGASPPIPIVDPTITADLETAATLDTVIVPAAPPEPDPDELVGVIIDTGTIVGDIEE